jgi:hypothetical protein
VTRPDASTDAIPRLENQNRATGLGERPRGGKSSGAGSDDHHIPGRLSHGSTSQFPYLSLQRLRPYGYHPRLL